MRRVMSTFTPARPPAAKSYQVIFTLCTGQSHPAKWEAFEMMQVGTPSPTTIITGRGPRNN